MQLNEQLLQAVTYHRVADVKRLLEEGANPNYDSYSGKSESDREGQPWAPLRMVMFRISDNLLEEKALVEFEEVARLLIKYGADPKPAMELAEHRYGKYNPNGESDLFMKVWDVVAVADQHSNSL